VNRFTAWFAVKVTSGVGTMWCAYAFAALAIVSLPGAINAGSAVVLVSWIFQTFLQLVLLSVIIVGQNVLAAAADKRVGGHVQRRGREIRLITRRGFGYHSPDAVIALAILTLGGLCPPLPGR
jgi:hypothetical protein